MIPKIIHYCWFGNGEKNDVIKKCIESWKVNCPDYEIMEWNESNFDVNAYAFTKEAYENKKWAFVSDVARLEALIQYGGFYLDTDVEILQKDIFDKYRQYQNVFAFETERRINTGLFYGCERNTAILHDFLQCYESMTFKGGFTQINTTLNMPVLEKYYPELIWNNQTQILSGTCFLGMNEYGKIMKHYAMHSWLDNKTAFKIGKETRLKKALRNPKIYAFLKKHFGNRAVNVYEFFSYDLLDMGVWYFIRRKFNKKKK